MKYAILFNPSSGTALSSGLKSGHLHELFAASGIDATVDGSDDPLETKVANAVASDADVIVSAGGDGTATAVAHGIAGSGKILAILPLGTANMLARDLGIPIALEKAVAALADTDTIEIDAGEVNGRLFLHNVVVGTIPAIAAARERVRGQNIVALLGFFRYLIRRLRNARRTAVSITSRDTDDRIERIHAIAVANNSYDQGWGKLFSRSCLDAGSLTLYILHRLSFADAVRLWLEMAMGRWQEDEALVIESVRSVTLGAKRQAISAMIDGEVATLQTPLNFRIRERAVRVLVPKVRAKAAEPA